VAGGVLARPRPGRDALASPFGRLREGRTTKGPGALSLGSFSGYALRTFLWASKVLFSRRMPQNEHAWLKE
jgi:hypothetical protein